MDIKNRDPLIVEVETSEKTNVNVLLTQGIDTRHFFELGDNISYFFGSDEATQPRDLIGLPLFGEHINFKCKGIKIGKNENITIKHVKKVFDCFTFRDITKDYEL